MITDKMLEKGSLRGLAGWDEEEHEDEDEYSDEEEEEEDDGHVCRECAAPRADGCANSCFYLFLTYFFSFMKLAMPTWKCAYLLQCMLSAFPLAAFSTCTCEL